MNFDFDKWAGNVGFPTTMWENHSYKSTRTHDALSGWNARQPEIDTLKAENTELKAEINRLKCDPAQIPWWQFIREHKNSDEFMCRKCEQKFFVHENGVSLPEECPSCKLRKEG